MRRNKPYDRSVFHAMALVMQFGINMIVPIGMLSALGWYLDRRYETSFWMILLFIVGAIAGAQNVYRMAKRVFEMPSQSVGDTEKETPQENESHGSIKKDQ